jgi:hypothetical protein
MLTRTDLEQAFSEIGEILFRHRQIGEIAVYGGASIILQFDVNFVTRDADVTINREHGAVEAAAREVARRHAWPASWLSEAVTMYLVAGGTINFFRNYPSDSRVGLRVFVAAPEYLLAMKIKALRANTRDAEDAALLAKATNITTVDGLTDLYNAFFPTEPLDPRRTVAIHEIVEKLDAP